MQNGFAEKGQIKDCICKHLAEWNSVTEQHMYFGLHEI